MLDLLPAEPLMNHETRVLTGYMEAKIYDVQLREGNFIKGFTEKYRFQTADKFNSFQYQEHHFPVDPYYLSVEGDNLYYIYGADNRINITFSRDYGQSWQTITPNFEGAAFEGLDPSRSQLHFVDDRAVFLMAVWGIAEIAGGEARLGSCIYSIDPGSDKATLVSVIEGFAPESIAASNSRLFLGLRPMVTQEGGQPDRKGLHISASDNAGESWTTPQRIGIEKKARLFAGSETNLFAMERGGMGYYSSDGGNSWNIVQDEFSRFLDAQFGSPDILYALIYGMLHKSIDGGKTWMVDDRLFWWGYVTGSRLYALNTNAVLVYNTEELLITEDGGETWRLLLSRTLTFQ